MQLLERTLGDETQGVAIGPKEGATCGVLVLAGSSGRVDVSRARLLAERGALALALRWFGGVGQAPGICEIPLETFTRAVDWLFSQSVKSASVVGLSKGAEAALLLACRDPRISAVVAISPSSVAWANVGPGLDGATYPYRSSWIWEGEPLPFVPYDDSQSVGDSERPIAFRPVYERSLASFPEQGRRAAIPIEQTRASVLLVAGEDDQMWPSAHFAQALASRRRTTGQRIEVISHPRAGHRPYFPGEQPPAQSPHYLYGGTPEADAALGAAAWPRALDHLGLAWR